MTNLILWMTVILAGISFVAYTAQSIEAAGYGGNWARDAGSFAPFACDNPPLLIFLTAGLAGLWILLKFAAAIRDQQQSFCVIAAL